jgi:hypothetical protein
MHGDDQVELRALLAHLSVTNGEAHRWRAWQIVPVAGGANNRLQRATTTGADLAIKWMLRDERDRAGREYAALAALQSLGLDLAPSPLLLDRTSYPLPVVVQTWLPGEALTAPRIACAYWRGGRHDSHGCSMRCRVGTINGSLCDHRIGWPMLPRSLSTTSPTRTPHCARWAYDEFPQGRCQPATDAG